MKGDVICDDTKLVCIGAVVNGSSVQFTLQANSGARLGWMGLGFGKSMVNSPLVVVWSNSDGSITVSQRLASSYVMPTVDPNPPFTATAEPSLSNLNIRRQKLVFSIPSSTTNLNLNSTQDVVWAFGGTNPDSSDPSATIFKHLQSGSSSLDLSKTVTLSSKNPMDPVASEGNTSQDSEEDNEEGSGVVTGPLKPFEKIFVAHAIICFTGFLILLPAGVLTARYIRTATDKWFTIHQAIQLSAGPVIVIGVGLGVAGVQGRKDRHFLTTHEKVGIGLFALYIAQVFLGVFVHWMRVRTSLSSPYGAAPWKRPIQNYVHVIIGLLLIGASMYQVRTGYKVEWPGVTGRGDLPNVVDDIWYIWIVLPTGLYFAGLYLLKHQFRKERKAQFKPLATYDEAERYELTHGNRASMASTQSGRSARSGWSGRQSGVSM